MFGINCMIPETKLTAVAASAPTDYTRRFTNVVLSGNAQMPPIVDSAFYNEA